jgi:hypothetical protein
MTTIEFAEQIKKQCVFLENDGYVFHHQPNYIWYTKADFVISFNYLVYDFIDAYALMATKRFNEVENALRLKDEYTILTQSEGEYHVKISDAGDVTTYVARIAAFYKEKVLSFFETYATLSAVNDWISAKPADEHQEMISSGEGLMVLRRILIMYHAGDKEYAALQEKYKAFLETKKTESPFNTIYQHLLEMEKAMK